MTRFMILVASLAVLLLPGVAQNSSPAKKESESFSAVQDFSTSSNPNGTWSYGYTTSLGGVFHLLPFGDGCDFDFCGWGFGPTDLDPPSVLTAGYLKIIGTLELQPGGSGEYSIVRWTAPATGKFETVGVFVGDRNCTTTDVHVLYNGASIFNDRIVCLFDPSLFHFAAKLKKGDTIDFAVSNDSTLNDDATGLDVTITTLADSASVR
jgi:hypothetical protein